MNNIPKKLFTMTKWLALFGLLLTAEAAGAASMTFQFTGVVTLALSSRDPLGSAMSGYVTIDPATLTNTQFSDANSLEEYNYYNPPGPFPQDGYATTASFNGSLGLEDGTFGSANLIIERNENGDTGYGDNGLSVTGGTYFCEGAVCGWNQVELIFDDNHGLNSTFFEDPNGGLSVTQPMDFMDETLKYGFLNWYDSTTNVFAMDQFNVTSMTVTMVPEPDTFALFGAALAALACSRKCRRIVYDRKAGRNAPQVGKA